MSEIFELLKSLGETSLQSREIFSTETRDKSNLNVWRDTVSGVIYIDDYYCGETFYSEGEYKDQNIRSNLDREYDTERRITQYRAYYTDKNIVDFGCGTGDFLRTSKGKTRKYAGIELQKSYREALNKEGISCYSDLSPIDFKIDTLFLFHTLEHFENPLDILVSIRTKLSPGSALIVEVPHANDFLLNNLNCKSFKKFTLWSPHLILHTRSSLHKILTAAGFQVDIIEGIQRYPLSNHLGWLSTQAPGGHKTSLNAIDTQLLTAAYEASLQKIDSTDTLVARASV